MILSCGVRVEDGPATEPVRQQGYEGQLLTDGMGVTGGSKEQMFGIVL